MAGSRRRAREIALQILYLVDANPELTAEQAMQLYFGSLASPAGGGEEGVSSSGESFDRQLTDDIVRGVVERRSGIDELLGRVSRTWRLERMARLDRNVLRLAVWELQHSPDVPMEVVINEAVDLARRFGSAEAPAFVNGILDSAAVALSRSAGS